MPSSPWCDSTWLVSFDWTRFAQVGLSISKPVLTRLVAGEPFSVDSRQSYSNGSRRTGAERKMERTPAAIAFQLRTIESIIRQPASSGRHHLVGHCSVWVAHRFSPRRHRLGPHRTIFTLIQLSYSIWYDLIWLYSASLSLIFCLSFSFIFLLGLGFFFFQIFFLKCGDSHDASLEGVASRQKIYRLGHLVGINDSFSLFELCPVLFSVAIYIFFFFSSPGISSSSWPTWSSWRDDFLYVYVCVD